MQAQLSVLHGAMAQVVTLRSLTAESRLRSHVSSCEICDGQRVTVTGFFPSTSVFPFQYHSTNAPYSSPFTCLLLPEGQTAEAWEPQKTMLLRKSRSVVQISTVTQFLNG
jgi:hypothetical protein